jgi:hypothetical protein
MENPINTGKQRFYFRIFGNAGNMQFQLCIAFMVFEVADIACALVVYDGYAMSVVEEPVYHVAAYESATSCNEYIHKIIRFVI